MRIVHSPVVFLLLSFALPALPGPDVFAEEPVGANLWHG